MSGDTVITFPSRGNRSWRVIEAYLCPYLYQLGADAAQVTHLCAVLQPLWEADPGLTLPDGIDGDERVRRLNEWFGNMAMHFLMAIAVRELKLFNAGIE